MLNKTRIIITSFILVILIGIIVFLLSNKVEKIIQKDSVLTEDISQDFESFHGFDYNTDLQTIVLLGIDNNQTVMEHTNGYSGQSDAIFVYVMNVKNDTGKLLQISRDTMVDLDVYDINGEYFSQKKGQIAMQYAYGDGKEESCILASERISELLNHIPIQAYISFDMGGISEVSKSFGGIDIVLEDDNFDINSNFKKGSKVHLEGEELEAFLRSRDVKISGSNDKRMLHHRQIIKSMMNKNIDNKEAVLKTAKPYMVTNLSFSEIEHIMSSQMDEAVIQIPGEVVEGDKHDEFYVDQKSLDKLILDLFYQ